MHQEKRRWLRFFACGPEGANQVARRLRALSFFGLPARETLFTLWHPARDVSLKKSAENGVGLSRSGTSDSSLGQNREVTLPPNREVTLANREVTLPEREVTLAQKEVTLEAPQKLVVVDDARGSFLVSFFGDREVSVQNREVTVPEPRGHTSDREVTLPGREVTLRAARADAFLKDLLKKAPNQWRGRQALRARSARWADAAKSLGISVAFFRGAGLLVCAEEVALPNRDLSVPNREVTLPNRDLTLPDREVALPEDALLDVAREVCAVFGAEAPRAGDVLEPRGHGSEVRGLASAEPRGLGSAEVRGHTSADDGVAWARAVVAELARAGVL